MTRDVVKKFFYTLSLNELNLMNHNQLCPDVSYNTLLYLDLIYSLEKSYPNVRCLVVHERDTELCERFFEERVPHIERNKILRMITAMPNRKESVKDYISMPALPFYLLGIKDILEIDSVD